MAILEHCKENGQLSICCRRIVVFKIIDEMLRRIRAEQKLGNFGRVMFEMIDQHFMSMDVEARFVSYQYYVFICEF